MNGAQPHETRSADPGRRPEPEPEPVEGVSGPQPREVPFGDVMVSAPVKHALADVGYDTPTPIQALVLAPMLSGRDIVGQAPTGTGKTAGFGIPLAETVDGAKPYVQAIILVPTRELAQQVADELSRLFKYRSILTVAVYGGAPMGRQVAALDAGAQVVVGTPGRVIDLLDRGPLKLERVQTVVLDEADQMLDIGFLPDIRRILRSTPRSRQTVLFAATMPTMIRRLIYSYLKEPEWFKVGEESTPVDSVRQMYCEVARRDKLEALLETLRTHDDGEQTLIFRRMQEDVNWLVTALKRRRIPAEAIHGGLRQTERNAVMQSFRDGTLKLLVSTNLTSRGIDVPAVAHVINYDTPEQIDEYVHRIGRTARMGRPGTAMTFVSEWDFESFDAIRAHVGAENIEEVQLSLYSPNRAAASRSESRSEPR
ncbi:MAG: DEAD/DEAH box helicase [Chloroflexi bacterium]|nr:DEAD/DEAH box helicase [Chloroflexota bacterium]